MNSQLHLLIVTTLSMIMTFVLYNSLKDTRVIDSYFQRTLIDTTRDSILFVRCLLNTEQINETCSYSLLANKSNRNFVISIYFLSITTLYGFGLYKNYYFMYCLIHTITSSWFLARFCNGFHIWCEFDIFTVYFFIWQFMSLVTKWEKEHFPLFSLNIYRGWLCIATAFEAFLFYDAIFRYLPLWVSFGCIWISSVEDIIACLHLKGRLHKRKPIEEISKDTQSVLCGYYYTWDIDDNQSNKKGARSALGLGDFVMFNFMLLLVLNPLSSIATNISITIGHIIAVQIGLEVTRRLGILYNQYDQPALPLSVITFLIYAFLLYFFLEY